MNENQTPKITSLEEATRKIEEKRYGYFTFPILELTVKYRKPDVLKLSYNGSLPAMMADGIIEAYKGQIEGRDMEEFKRSKQDLQADDQFIKELGSKGYNLLKELVVGLSLEDTLAELKVLDVPKTDIGSGVLAWVDVPEEDSIAFLMHLLYSAQKATTVEGGEIDHKDLDTFSKDKSVSKRNPSGKNGKVVRQIPQ